MLVSEFDYLLPPDLIAQQPLADRAASRMLHVHRRTGVFTDKLFRELPTLLRPGDLMVVNNTRVLPSRLFGRRSGARAQPVSGRNPASKQFLRGRVEVLLTRQLSSVEWEALVRPGRKIGVGEQLTFDDELHATVIGRGEFGERRLRFDASREKDFFGALDRIGHIPLPPYIDRPDSAEDRVRYQTVFSRLAGSAAAPTAGLHFTPEILDRVRAHGVEVTEVTLHVGLGTFQPLRKDLVEQNQLHSEHYEISPAAADAINRAKAEGRRVVAVGTTSVRTLEAAASRESPPRVMPGSGEASLFIYPGFNFQIVDALLTNFHLPRSSLLILVCAFTGKEITLQAYAHAVEQGYRFFSYGDCMFIED